MRDTASLKAPTSCLLIGFSHSLLFFLRADIELTRAHSLGLDGGRNAVERVAQQLEADIGVDYQWEGDTLRFDGQGAEGQIEVEDGTVEILINLSMFLRPMQSQVKAEAEEYLDRYF